MAAMAKIMCVQLQSSLLGTHCEIFVT